MTPNSRRLRRLVSKTRYLCDRFLLSVVPKDQARIRVQISAGHNREHLDRCIAAFIKVGKELRRTEIK